MSPSGRWLCPGPACVLWPKFLGKKKIEGKSLRLEPADTRQEVRRDKEGRIETPNSFARLKSRSHE